MEIELEFLKELLKKPFDYDEMYDFDDMKLGIVCKDFMSEAIELEYIDYEDIFRIVKWIKVVWMDRFYNLIEEEQGYIQEFARRVLNENINEIENILKNI